MRGNRFSNCTITALSISNLATSSAPSCSPSYTSSILPVMDGIIDIKSTNLMVVFSELVSINRNFAAAIRFSIALIVSRALTPLLASTYSLFRAVKATSSKRFLAKFGTRILALSSLDIFASCSVISRASAIDLG